MAQVCFVGLDLAKNVFQVHGSDDRGHPVLSKQVRRADVLKFFANLPTCTVGMEACSGAHYWARELGKLGHDCKLIPARYVKAYVKTNKNDAKDAEAICEAVQRPTMHFVAVKSVDQQAVLMLHRTRETLVRQRVQLSNFIRSQLAEFGVVMRPGANAMPRLTEDALRQEDDGLPPPVRELLRQLLDHLRLLIDEVGHLERRIEAWHRGNAASLRLAQIPGIGLLTASALVASIGDVGAFKSPSHLAAWLGLVPRQYSTGGKPRLGGISKRGDVYLRTLLIHGARVVLYHLRTHPNGRMPWLDALMGRCHFNAAAVALAHKNARAVWAMLTRSEDFSGYRSVSLQAP